MDYTSADRQEAMRKRDKQQGIGYLQLRISDDVKEILRKKATENKKKLSEYVRDYLEFLAAQIVKQESGEASIPQRGSEHEGSKKSTASVSTASAPCPEKYPASPAF